MTTVSRTEPMVTTRLSRGVACEVAVLMQLRAMELVGQGDGPPSEAHLEFGDAIVTLLAEIKRRYGAGSYLGIGVEVVRRNERQQDLRHAAMLADPLIDPRAHERAADAYQQQAGDLAQTRRRRRIIARVVAWLRRRST